MPLLECPHFHPGRRLFTAALVVLVFVAGREVRADERYAGSFTLDTSVALDPGWLYPAAGVGAAERLGLTLHAQRFRVDGGVGQFWVEGGVQAAFFHYGVCYESALGCTANYVFAPIGLRFGVGVVSGWSLVFDLGAGPYLGYFPNVCGPPGSTIGSGSCPPSGAPKTEGVFPAASVGGTIALGRHAELAFGLGIPTVYAGVSFL